MRVTKAFKFDSAHSLPDYNGPCVFLHGHTYLLEVTLEGVVDHESGFVMDYTEMKAIIDPLILKLDHSNLNTIIQNPTCENLVLHIGNYIKDQIEADETLLGRLWALEISLQEGTGGWASESFGLFGIDYILDETEGEHATQ